MPYGSCVRPVCCPTYTPPRYSSRTPALGVRARADDDNEQVGLRAFGFAEDVEGGVGRAGERGVVSGREVTGAFMVSKDSGWSSSTSWTMRHFILCEAQAARWHSLLYWRVIRECQVQAQARSSLKPETRGQRPWTAMDGRTQ